MNLEQIYLLCEQDVLSNPKLTKMLRGSEKSLKKFCRKNSIELESVGITMESTKPELMYYFSDNLGGYTLRGIKKSLLETEDRN